MKSHFTFRLRRAELCAFLEYNGRHVTTLNPTVETSWTEFVIIAGGLALALNAELIQE